MDLESIFLTTLISRLILFGDGAPLEKRILIINIINLYNFLSKLLNSTSSKCTKLVVITSECLKTLSLKVM